MRRLLPQSAFLLFASAYALPAAAQVAPGAQPGQAPVQPGAPGGQARPGLAQPVPAPAPVRPGVAQPAPAQPGLPATRPGQPTRPAPAETLTAPEDLTLAVPGGITAEQVGERAVKTSFQAQAAVANIQTAEARVDQANANWYPRLGLLARYTRLSFFHPPPFATGGSGASTGPSLVGTTDPPGTVNPNTVAIDPAALSRGFGSLPLVLDQYLTQATLQVPISDYFFRIGKAYTAATRAVEAARYDAIAAKTKSFSDGKLAYFTWMRARGGVTVAEQSLAVARAHQKDAENLFAVGNASKADVLRAQTQVAVAESGVERAKNNAAIAERQVRVAVHAKEDERIAPGEPLDAPLPPAPRDLPALVSEARANRPEVKSLERNADALRKSASVTRAGNYPQLSAFGDVTYANPNPRRFPQRTGATDRTWFTTDSIWFPTWSAGIQLSWSPNDVLTSAGGASELDARASALEAQRQATEDGIDMEVTAAYQDVLTADAAVESTGRQLESATEGYRVARELFNNGRGTGTTLIDAEVALAQARFDNLNARVDARVARGRLMHATGRDVVKVNAAP